MQLQCIACNCAEISETIKTLKSRVLHGMRFISAVLVVGLHQGMFSIVSPNMYINSLDLDKMFKSALGQGFTQVNLVVDTFFSMSGLLLMKGIMSGRQRNLLVVLLKRYFRLVGPYAAVTFYIMCVAPHTASGPIWPRVNAMEGDVCEKHWWKNFFMISNDLKTMCFGVAWYVTCDFHLAILTVILYWIYRRNRRNGVVAFVVVSCALTLQLAVMAYRKRMPLVIFNNIHVLAYIRDYEFINDFYIKWHDRAGTYLVGVTMGWLMAIYKPPQYRNVISKTKSFIMALVSLYVMLKVITINTWFGDAGRVEVAVAVATNRAVWAIAICSLIGACEYGSVPFISDFLGSAVFVPLSKLSYGIYMTHFFLLQINLHAVRSPLKFDPFYLVICVLGTTVLACFVSLALYLVVEAPCKNISNLYLSERDDGAGLCSISPVNGTNHQNGNTKLKAS